MFDVQWKEGMVSGQIHALETLLTCVSGFRIRKQTFVLQCEASHLIYD